MRHLLLAIGAALALLGCETGEKNTVKQPLLKALPDAPVAERREHSFSHHGISVSDPWHWLRDQEYPTVNDQPVLDYLNAENAYFHQWLAPNKALTDSLFNEFKGRLDETETSVPWVVNGYEYRWEFREGQEYRTRLRKPVGAPASEETVFLDETALAEGHDYFVLSDYSISPDNRYVAYSVDTSGDERYVIRIKDLTSGEYLADEISDAGGSVLFAQDGSLIYESLEPVKWRIKSINRHRLGTPVSDDQELLAESDDSFFMSFQETSDQAYLIVGASKRGVSEYYALPQNQLDAAPVLLASRDEKFEYDVDHAHGKFWFRANDQHVNFRLASADDDAPDHRNWTTLIAGSDSVYIRDIKAFKDFFAIKQSVDGLEQIVLRDYAGNSQALEFPESVFSVSMFSNTAFDQTHLRLNYTSMITPATVFDYQIADKKLVERKVDRIPSGYDKSQYETQRIMVAARDGVKVPVSLVYRKGTKRDGKNPLHLYAYGAYGYGMPARFSANVLSLVDRGVVYAIAHVRGGDEMGYQWYLDGKLTKRTNTFNDFVDVARGLIGAGYTQAGNISISGRSAGGELMGAAVIQAPELWSSVILGVPFVDVLNTMLDATLPLTPPEWTEWGNPIEDKAAFELLLGYSPYDNIGARDYPPMLVLGGLNDPRVTYWEPAKWTASMRHHKTDANLLIMRMNMGAGHFANSGRYGRLRDYAEEYTFMLLSHGITQ